MTSRPTTTWAKAMAAGAALALSLTACGSDSGSTEASGESSSPSDAGSSSADSGSDSGSSEQFTNDECSANATSADFLKVGGILPLTGNLAFLGPPEIAGVGLAVNDINAAGGVDGTEACHDIQDSGDSTDMSVSTSSAGSLIQGQPSVVVGAASSSVSLNVVDTFADAQIVQISPANTAVDLSGYSDFYFRTAPPDTIQGNALGNLVASDGFQKVAFLVFNDTYGTGLRNYTQQAIEAAGGEVVYGGRGDGNEFPAGQTTFSSDVSAALKTNPDAIVILAFDETKAIVPELAAQGWDMSKAYFSDGNTADYGEDFEPGTLTGAKGTIPGADAAQDFKDRLSSWYESAEGQGLSDYAYAAESYDATILAALAAIKGGSTESATIQQNLAAVSGSTGGQACGDFEECAGLLADGEEIQYQGPSGIGPINDQNDPSSAFVGIYQFNEENAPELVTTVEGQS